MATAKKAPAAAGATKAAPAKKRTPNAAFMKALTPSPALAANKRMINADAKLKEVFGKPQVSMFEMAGLIGKHVK